MRRPAASAAPAAAWAAVVAGCLAVAAGSASARQAPGAADAAAPLTVTLAAPPGEITVGDPVPLKLTVAHPAGAVCTAPDAGALKATGPAAKDLSVEQIAQMESAPAAGVPAAGTPASETAWIIRVRPFSPGDLSIESLTVSCQAPGAAAPASGASQPLALRVASVLKDPGEEASDIKGPWHLPRSWWLALGLLAGALAVVSILFALWRRRRRRPPAPVAAPAIVEPPAEHPYHRAMRELGKLLASTLLAQGRVKEFHVLLSEIVKRFLAGVHGFDALDRTTEEVLVELLLRGVSHPQAERARLFLQDCDLVKFAKHHPDASGIDATVAAARALIESGRPRQEAAA